MKIYTKVVLGPEFEIVEEQSYEYEGPLALAGGGGSEPTTKQPQAGIIVRRLWRGNQPNTPFASRLASVGHIGAEDPYRNAAVQRLTNDINAQYGARGLATSGIGLKGVNEAITNFDLGREEQKTDQAIKILSTASGGPTPVQGSQGSGFLGLK